jgi:hypothetical protein
VRLRAWQILALVRRATLIQGLFARRVAYPLNRKPEDFLGAPAFPIRRNTFARRGGTSVQAGGTLLTFSSDIHNFVPLHRAFRRPPPE